MGARLGVSFDGFSPFHEAISFGKEAVACGATSLRVADHWVIENRSCRA